MERFDIESRGYNGYRDMVKSIDGDYVLYEEACTCISELERQLAEARAERDRALDGLARVHEQYLKEAK